jgi:hypothetical protein
MNGYSRLETNLLKDLGFQEIFEQENLCVIKLSSSGGDPKLINTAITALWKHSKVRSIVFPGHEKTAKKIIQKVERHSPQITQSLDEEVFYNVARVMEPKSQMLVTYPSEQFKHIMVLSKLDQRLKVVWLPPRGEHEIINLIEYILIASTQNLKTTICIPKNYQADLHKKFWAAGFSPIYYQLVDPNDLSKDHFHLVPSWVEHETQVGQNYPRISASTGIKNIIAKHQ